MANKKEANPKVESSPLLSLATMLGSGEDFFVETKKYKVKPLKLKDVGEFFDDKINIGPQMYSMTNETERAKIEKWLSRQVFDENNEPVTLQRAIDDDWDLSDLRRCIQKMIDISG